MGIYNPAEMKDVEKLQENFLPSSKHNFRGQNIEFRILEIYNSTYFSIKKNNLLQYKLNQC